MTVAAFLPALLIVATALYGSAAAYGQQFIRGVDLSHLDRVEASGGVFRDAGTPGDAMLILRDHGANWVRLRLWHSPAGGWNGLDRTVEMARRIRSAGMHFLLDIHYSDSWADPGKQTKPAAWRSVGFDALKDSVRTYTERVIAELRDANALPHMVQIGNEITSGMLWPDGRVGGSYDTPTQWRKFGELLKAGIEGLGSAGGDSVEIMVHIDRGGSSSGSRWFYDNLIAQDVSFDVIGLSFYPWWHGTVTNLKNNLEMLSSRYDKEIVVVETAYPWTLQWGDNENNIVGLPEHLHEGYPASVTGQRDFLEDLFQIVYDTPRGRGVVFWEPAHIPSPGFGSPWENLALFSFQGNLLASAEAFRTASSLASNDHQATQGKLSRTEAYPNPSSAGVRIEYHLERPSHVELRIYDMLGRRVTSEDAGVKVPGRHDFDVGMAGRAVGVYLYEVLVDNERSDTGILIRSP